MKPLIPQRADPFILQHSDGWYYFTASEPGFAYIELRRAKTVEGLAEAQPAIVWKHHATGPMSRYIWAPEIHCLNGKWYLYFAATDTEPSPGGMYDHRTYVLENTSPNPMEGQFTEKGRIDTGWDSFTLDATVFESDGQAYMVWAQKDNAIPGNSNLYIAKMQNPWTLKLPAVMLSKPEFDWECQGYLVNEGPAVLAHKNKLFLTYSGSATDERYAMGMLVAQKGSELLNPASWHKHKTPVMVTEPEHQLYGPGHNSFTKDLHGEDVLVFHARPYPGFHGTALSDPNRHCYVRTLRYNNEDMPVFSSEPDA